MKLNLNRKERTIALAVGINLFVILLKFGLAPATSPIWTPLFSLAAGVITDVGGPLSHSSIVAREYHIPAVLVTGVATERLHSGQRVTVDGDAGTVTISSTGK